MAQPDAPARTGGELRELAADPDLQPPIDAPRQPGDHAIAAAPGPRGDLGELVAGRFVSASSAQQEVTSLADAGFSGFNVTVETGRFGPIYQVDQTVNPAVGLVRGVGVAPRRVLRRRRAVLTQRGPIGPAT